MQLDLHCSRVVLFFVLLIKKKKLLQCLWFSTKSFPARTQDTSPHVFEYYPALPSSKSKTSWLQPMSCLWFGSEEELLLLDSPITPLWPFTPHSWRLLGWEGAWYSRAALLLSITEAKLTILNIAVVLFSYKCKAERWEIDLFHGAKRNMPRVMFFLLYNCF